MEYKPLGRTDISVPPIIFGTSCLGNLYETLSDATKYQIMQEWFNHQHPPVILDSAGKYGAGLALEVIGSGLKAMNICSDDVVK